MSSNHVMNGLFQTDFFGMGGGPAEHKLQRRKLFIA